LAFAFGFGIGFGFGFGIGIGFCSLLPLLFGCHPSPKAGDLLLLCSLLSTEPKT
jgi:hypothetical protein